MDEIPQHCLGKQKDRRKPFTFELVPTLGNEKITFFLIATEAQPGTRDTIAGSQVDLLINA